MSQDKTGPRIIKRYQNRKLYDTEQSCYVTLDEIAEMVKDGEDVKVIDNKSGEDLTSLTLTQIIFEEEKKKKSILPLAALRNIIQSGGNRSRACATVCGRESTRFFMSRRRPNSGCKSC